MGFNIFFAGGHTKASNKFIFDHGGNRLFTQMMEKSTANAWMDYRKEEPKEPGVNKLFVDSSAYTAHTKGIEIDIDEYIKYLNDNQGEFQIIAELDKIPGVFHKPKTRQQLLDAPKISWENYLYMRERVIDYDNILPIFHQGEDWKWLETMLETTFENDRHIQYIGISPANDLRTNQKSVWMEQVFRRIRDSSNPNVKTHAFGMTAFEELERFPFYSADSTSPLLTGAMGNIFTPQGMLDVSDKSNGLKVLRNSPKSVQMAVDELIEHLGYTLEEISADHQIRAYYNVLFVIEWAANYKFKGIKHKQKTIF